MADVENKKIYKRKKGLYGPARTLARDAAKSVQQEDHVFVNFQKGSEPYEPLETFLSETTASFKVLEHV